MRAKLFFPILLMFAFVSSVSAQWNVVLETTRPMSFGDRPCFRLEFAGADEGTVVDLWKTFVKDNYKGKLKKDKRSGEWMATGLKASMMGSANFGVYSTIEKSNGGVALTIWYDAGEYFLSRREDPGRAEEVVRSLHSFYYDVRRSDVNKQIKEEEQKLKDLEARQKKLEKDNEGLRKDIENYKAKIKKAEEDVVKNEKDQESNILDIEAQRRVLEDKRRRLENVENEGN